ncbi:MAG: hypothetical protein CM15mP74_19150 [Halieaceae bacterium]|nr:MAG: hypothetical protein CM15mP74_19150 [Halieaceae bacterium]
MPIFYDARCFSVLNTVLERFNQWILKPELDPERDLQDRLDARVANDLTALLTQWRYRRAIEHIQRAAAAPEARQTHANIWLDGFRLLKIIHLLRDHHYPNLTFQASAASLDQWPIELPSPVAHTNSTGDLRAPWLVALECKGLRNLVEWG